MTISIPTALSNLTSLPTQVYASIPPELQPYFTREYLQTILRLVVIIATYLLFRPHLESLFRKASGAHDPKQAEIQARLEALRNGVPVAGSGSVENPSLKQAQVGKGKKAGVFGGGAGGGKVVKLVVPGSEGAGEAQGGTAGQQQQQGKATGKANAKTRRRADTTSYGSERALDTEIQSFRGLNEFSEDTSSAEELNQLRSQTLDVVTEGENPPGSATIRPGESLKSPRPNWE